jgi:hypothetical protein
MRVDLSILGALYVGRSGMQGEREKKETGSTYCINNCLGKGVGFGVVIHQCTISLVILARVQNGNRVAGYRRGLGSGSLRELIHMRPISAGDEIW